MIRPGDLLVISSDGIVEATDADEEDWAAEDDPTLVIARLQPIQTERIPAAEVELSMSLGVER